MIKKIMLAVAVSVPTFVNALEIDIEQPTYTVESFKTKDYKFIGENDYIKLYINPKQIYSMQSSEIEDIRILPIRFDLKVTENENNKSGYTYINYTFVNCNTKQNYTVFVHTFDEKGNFIREDINKSDEWQNTEEKSNNRAITEYICKF